MMSLLLLIHLIVSGGLVPAVPGDISSGYANQGLPAYRLRQDSSQAVLFNPSDWTSDERLAMQMGQVICGEGWPDNELVLDANMNSFIYYNASVPHCHLSERVSILPIPTLEIVEFTDSLLYRKARKISGKDEAALSRLPIMLPNLTNTRSSAYWIGRIHISDRFESLIVLWQSEAWNGPGRPEAWALYLVNMRSGTVISAVRLACSLFNPLGSGFLERAYRLGPNLFVRQSEVVSDDTFISDPDKLIAAGYRGVNLNSYSVFQLDDNGKVYLVTTPKEIRGR